MPGIFEALKASLSTAATDDTGLPVPGLHRYLPLLTTVAGVGALALTVMGIVPSNPQIAALEASLAAIGSAYVMRMGHVTPVKPAT